MNLTDEDIELALLLEAIYLKYGFDFRSYSRGSIKRQVLRRLEKDGLGTIPELQNKVLCDPDFFNNGILLDFSNNYTQFFRDPSFFKAVRNEVIPILRTYPNINIWHAGCSTGQEVYSMAILIEKEGLLDKCQIYATDINLPALAIAQKGQYPLANLEDGETQLQNSGLEGSMHDYFKIIGDTGSFLDRLKNKILFSDYNLVTDKVFGEMHLILCRNVLIYFNDCLRLKVLNLFKESLCHMGFLCLGRQEIMHNIDMTKAFESYIDTERIYRKI